MSAFIDITGERYGRLRCLKRDGSATNKKAVWSCLCDCGNTVRVRSTELRGGRTVSCGCYQDEIRRINGRAGRTHGREPRVLYNRWQSMLARCYYKKHKSFAAYGGRGITVCDEWRHDFVAFRSWALANGFRLELTLEREDNDLGYSPGNCTFATPVEQCQNKRTSIVVTVDGVSKSLAGHAKDMGIDPSTVQVRWKRGVRGNALFHKGRLPSRSNT